MKLTVDNESFMDLDEWNRYSCINEEPTDIARTMGKVTVEVWKVFGGEYGPYWTWKAYHNYMKSSERILREDCAVDTMEEAMRDAYHAIINTPYDKWETWYV